MYWLIITAMVVIHGHGMRPGPTMSLEYPTRFTCEKALQIIDEGLLERAVAGMYGRRHIRHNPISVHHVKSECRSNELVDPGQRCDLDWRATCSNTINRI